MNARSITRFKKTQADLRLALGDQYGNNLGKAWREALAIDGLSVSVLAYVRRFCSLAMCLSGSERHYSAGYLAMFSVDAIYQALKDTPIGSDWKILTPAEAAIRAEMVYQDMKQVGFEFDIQLARVGPFHVPYYELKGSDFGKDQQGPKEHPTHESVRAHGLGLNWASLLRLSKACKIGRTIAPDLWPDRFKKDLIAPTKHISCVEEMLWLGMWHSPTDVAMAASPFPPCEKDVDWRFRCKTTWVNLEVKYRPRDWVKHVDGPEFARMFESYFSDIHPKFPAHHEGELNLAAITTFGGVDHRWRDCARSYLQKFPTIDGILVWSLSPEQSRDTFEVISDQRGFIETLFTHGDSEDRTYMGVFRHERRILENGRPRAMTPQEGIDLALRQARGKQR